LPAVVERIAVRLRAETAEGGRRDLLTAAFVLLGSRYESAFICQRMQGVRVMEGSTTDQWIVQQGEMKEGRKLLRLMGTERLGKPPAEVRRALESISESSRLEELALRLLKVNSWAEPLEGPAKLRSPRKNHDA
jgi:hypothetical protein